MFIHDVSRFRIITIDNMVTEASLIVLRVESHVKDVSGLTLHEHSQY